MPAPTRPAPHTIGRVHARVVRGPDREGRWYWRADVREAGATRTLWRGWATEDGVDREVGGIVHDRGYDGPARGDRAETVGHLLGYWMAAQRGRPDLAPRTLVSCRASARRVKADLGAVRCDRLDRRDLEGHRDRRLRAGDAPRTVALDLSTLRQAWRYGVQVGLVDARDLPRVGVRLEDRNNRRTPTAADVAAVAAHLQGWQRLAVLLLYGTGCRLMEVARLRWEDVDLVAGTVSVSGKTGSRVVPLHAQVAGAIRSAPRRGSYVLGVEPDTLRRGLRDAIAVACLAADVPTWTPHGLRRLACDTLYRTGVDVGTAASLLGHSPATALRHYRRATEADLRAAVDRARLGVLPAGNVVLLRTGTGSGPETAPETGTGGNGRQRDGDDP